MRNYYMGALTILILERTQFPVTPRAFVTSGERAAGTQYYWDASMQAAAWALLEPEGMKAVLRRWLVQNARSGVAIDLNGTRGFDPIYYNNITGYAFNACTIFKTADEYLRVTGDLAFLDDKLEDGKTVLDHMDAFATDWETLPKGPQGLVDYIYCGNALQDDLTQAQESEMNGFVTFTDVVVNTFFGFSPSPAGKSLITDPQTPRPFQGTLSAVRYG